MKFSQLSQGNQNVLQSIEVLDSKKRKNRARHKKQFKTDPASSTPKASSVSVWEFLVDPYTPGNGCSPGRFRFLRRSVGSDAKWYWAVHAGDDVSFKSFEEITDIPNFKPVRQTAAQSTGQKATPATTATLAQQDVTTVVKEREKVVEDWEDLLDSDSEG